MARQRDYKKEYQQRQAKARREGFKSYGAKRWFFGKRARLERAAVRQYVNHFGSLVNTKTLRKGFGTLSDAELRGIQGASLSSLRRRARMQPYPTSRGILNPYWYH